PGICLYGSIMFAALFALSSIILLSAFSDAERDSYRLHHAFYGNGAALLRKYSALLLCVGLSPVFYFFMWQESVPRSIRISGGFLMETLLFFLLLLMAESFITARAVIREMEAARRAPGAKRIAA